MDELNKEAKEILQAASKGGCIIIRHFIGSIRHIQVGRRAFGKKSHQMSQNYIDALEYLESAGLVRMLNPSTYELTQDGRKAATELAGGGRME